MMFQKEEENPTKLKALRRMRHSVFALIDASHYRSVLFGSDGTFFIRSQDQIRSMIVNQSLGYA